MDRSPADEATLIARARSGEESAFAELVLMHSERVMAILRRFGLTPTEVEEVTQEVFLRAWRGLPSFEGRAQFSTWLYRIAFNEAQRLLVRRHPTLPASVGAFPDPRLEAPELAPDTPKREPEAQALDREFETVLQRALAELPADCRAAVVLRDLEGLSTQQAAKVVGARQATFKSRLHRGRTPLRTLLAPYLGRDQR
jgi:RNA polymerase sigma-70 factor, ECF subfamily